VATLTLDAPAKVNLCLRVAAPRDDGYHPLSTVFCALDLADTVEVRTDPPDGPGLVVTFEPPLQARPDLGDPSANLATRAARGFLERAGLPESATPRIRLTKRIPAAGGLGGGSSDAAAVLRAMDRLYPGAVDPHDLSAVAARLGSDVPFFLLDTALALATGRGERVRPLHPLPSRPVVLVLPGFGVATADAYGWLDTDRRSAPSSLPDPPAPTSWAGVAELAVNDLEPPVLARHPRLRDVRDALRDAGAGVALLAGSGSSVFGVFADEEAARRAAATVGTADVRAVVVTATREP
jgi:4-diphosphocytidyl-2-C-methyl-D-erythritol kinase